MNVAVQEIESRFSEYLRRMQSGEEIVVTDQGKPVARLVPAEATVEEAEKSAIERFRALPWVRPGKGGKIRGSKDPIPWKPGDKLLSDIISEDRG